MRRTNLAPYRARDLPKNKPNYNNTIEMNLVRKLAWSFHNSTGIEYDDLFQDAAMTWVLAEQDPNYDPRRSALYSYAYLRMHTQLVDTTSRERKNGFTTEIPIELEDKQPNHLNSIMLRQTLSDLPRDAQFLIRMIFTSPGEFLAPTAFQAQRHIVEFLEEKLGWDQKRTKAAIKHIKEMIKHEL